MAGDESLMKQICPVANITAFIFVIPTCQFDSQSDILRRIGRVCSVVVLLQSADFGYWTIIKVDPMIARISS